MLSKDDKEYTKISRGHFKNIFSWKDITFDPTVLDLIKDRPLLKNLDDIPTFEEILKILRKQ